MKKDLIRFQIKNVRHPDTIHTRSIESRAFYSNKITCSAIFDTTIYEAKNCKITATRNQSYELSVCHTPAMLPEVIVGVITGG